MTRTCIVLTFLHDGTYCPPYKALDHLVEGERDVLPSPEDPDAAPACAYEVETFDRSDPDDVAVLSLRGPGAGPPDETYARRAWRDAEAANDAFCRYQDAEDALDDPDAARAEFEAGHAILEDLRERLAHAATDAGAPSPHDGRLGRRLEFLAGLQAAARDLLDGSEPADYIDTGDVIDFLHRVVTGPAAEVVLVLTDPDTGDRAPTTLQDFLDANAEDPDVCGAVAMLRPGESVAVGGGAAGRFVVERPAPGAGPAAGPAAEPAARPEAP